MGCCLKYSGDPTMATAIGPPSGTATVFFWTLSHANASVEPSFDDVDVALLLVKEQPPA